jgi:chromosome segregation ATPase
MSAEADSLKEQLTQLRSRNRGVASENRRLLGELKKIEVASEELANEHASKEAALESTLQSISKSLESHGHHRSQQRGDRRRVILAEVRKQSEANKVLTGEIRDIEAEIERIKQIYTAYPSRYAWKGKASTARK